MPVAQPNDLTPLSNQPPSVLAARVVMVMAAASDLTDSLAKLANHLPSRPMVRRTFSAKALTTGASSSLNRPASRAFRDRLPRDAEVR